MESLDVETCKKIGQLLYDSAPDEAKQVIMRAELSLEGDACRFEYDYVDAEGKIAWFSPEKGLTAHKLGELLVEHRAFFISQNQPPWKYCEFTLDVEKSKFSIQLSYD
ncbi:hypothetical protein [Andreprevotia chitinilytica]|uniref:hypothetical protein n=1 Tax=Andreprevotia chitinilytica TaxID=396808 RepID=UPI000556F94F|nr:hypothetical protein [Andreprevotia chitinilytica]